MTYSFAGSCGVFFILNSLPAAWRGYPGAAFWAKEHLGDAEHPGLFSQGHKGNSIICSVGHENKRQHLWTAFFFSKKLSYPVPSTSETCSLQSPTSLLWVTPSPPLALPVCPFQGTWDLLPMPLLFPTPMTAWSPDPFPAPSSSITKNLSIATGGSCFYIW